jgi:Na+/melibiose symporter-like transporter
METTGNKGKKLNESGRVGFGRMMAWQSRQISTSIQLMVLAGLQLYCTNALGMNAALVGILLMGSKIFDGITDLVAGYVVDRTNTRWGRGRPYEFCLIGLWVTTWLSFSVPAEAAIVVKSVWVVLAYTFTQSIFLTFLNASDTVYMVRAFNNEQAYIKLSSFGGLITTTCVVIFNVISPMLQARVLYNAAGWSRMVLFISMPMAIIGMMRFIFIKEDKTVDTNTEKVNLKNILAVLRHNKNIYPIAFAWFSYNLFGNMGIVGYYFIYIVGSLEISGVMTVFAAIAMLTLPLFPALLKKMAPKQLIQYSLLLTIPAGIILFIAKDKLPLLAIGGFIGGLSSLPLNFLYRLLVIDCCLYNEWQGRPRMEGTLSSITGFAAKLGSAFGSFILGVLLSLSGFDGTLTVQSESANMMLRFLYSFNSTFWCVLAAFLLCFYKIDRMKPGMIKDIEARSVQ